MANQFDLEEQEQLDELKHFWQQYGNAITWILIAVLGAYAAWNGYQYWQRRQAAQASAMFDEVTRFVATGDADKADHAFSDMRDRFASTIYAQQAGLLVAKMAYEAGKVDIAKTDLLWVSDKAKDPGYASLARLRLAGIFMDGKSYDEALAAINTGISDEFAALASDRRGDILLAQNKKSEAKDAYLKAYKSLDESSSYRHMVEVKLNALGINPADKPSDVAGTPTETGK